MLRVLVVDDQPLARLRLRDLLDERADVEIVGEAPDVPTALVLIDELRPDLAFVDIHMPGPSGLEVLRSAEPKPLVVFTTAHDQHAVTAFELNALDYLLKPFGSRRLAEAIGRARDRLPSLREASKEHEDMWQRVDAVRNAEGPLRRIYVRSRGRVVPVDLTQVNHLEADGDYVVLWEGERKHLVRVGLTHLASRLDPDTFVRVHRSHVINLDSVRDFAAHDSSRIKVTLKTGREVIASRARSVELRRRFSIS